MSSNLIDLLSLRDLPRGSAEAVLAAATSSVAPAAQLGPPLRLSDAEEKAMASLLVEVKQRLQLFDIEQTRETNAKITDFLTSTLLNTALRNADVAPIRERLGEAGQLRTDLYRVEFPPDKEETIKSLGVSTEQVIQIVKSPQRVQHLRNTISNVPTPETIPNISLYASTNASKREKDLRTLLVLTMRTHDRQVVWDVLVLYHSEFAFVPSDPVDILRAFVGKYGLDIRVAGSDARKLFLNEQVPIISESPSTELISIPKGQSRRGYLRAFARREDELVIIGIAFGVNVDEYFASLSKHGISARLSHRG